MLRYTTAHKYPDSSVFRRVDIALANKSENPNIGRVAFIRNTSRAAFKRWKTVCSRFVVQLEKSTSSNYQFTPTELNNLNFSTAFFS